MAKETSKTVKGQSGSVVSRYGGKRFAPHVQVLTNSHNALGNALNVNSTEVRNDRPPLANSGRADFQRPRDIRGSLKVINNVAFEHVPSVTVVQPNLQPQFKRPALTLVNMTPLETLSERLTDAMRATDPPTTASALARACDVSAAAVGKWLDGGKMSADSLASAARALGVRDEWLRTGRLPRERDSHDTQVDNVMTLLAGMKEPLAALSAAIEALGRAQPQAHRKRHRT